MASAPDPLETTHWLAAVFCPQCQSTFVPPSPSSTPVCPSCGQQLKASPEEPVADDVSELPVDETIVQTEFGRARNARRN
ncbi:MAG: hypothetical protein U0872_00200 [Planctomycetaceae bacterium]